MSTPPHIECDRQHPTYQVSDVNATIDFYTKKLGFTLGFTWGEGPHMAGLNIGDVSIHVIHGTPNPKGHMIYFAVGDADELFEFQKANGVEVMMPPTDQPYDMRDYRIKDLDGYELGFGHYLMAKTPALKIERVDVPVRLEKRLAALLKDLAEHKGMSIDSTLEETLLHTFEKVSGDGVASPHTNTTLRYIQELKKKHGIDYDVHASYRFVE